MAEDTPLTPQQRRAAALLAQGKEVREVAEEVGVSPKTISSRWKKREDFRELVRRDRESLIPADGVPTAESVLIEGLTATTPSGRPAWGVRLTAAKALLGSPVASKEAEQQARTTVIYMNPDTEEPYPADDLDADLALDSEDEDEEGEAQ